MSESKHTPGPWHFDHDWGRLPTIFGSDRKTKIAIVEKTSRNEHTSEQAADASLIAAAPDLLAALKDITRFCDAVRVQVGMGKTQLARLEAARSAIAKAEPTQ